MECRPMLKSAHTADEPKSSFQHASLPQASDEDLLSAIAGGAVWAMEPLHQRYSRLLYSLAYAMVADYQVAQDLTQESFLAVWRHASAYVPQAGAVRPGSSQFCATAPSTICALFVVAPACRRSGGAGRGR